MVKPTIKAKMAITNLDLNYSRVVDSAERRYDEYFKSIFVQGSPHTSRFDPTTMIPTDNGLVEMQNEQIRKIFRERAELERLRKEIPAVEELYEQLQVMIKLYRE